MASEVLRAQLVRLIEAEAQRKGVTLDDATMGPVLAIVEPYIGALRNAHDQARVRLRLAVGLLVDYEAVGLRAKRFLRDEMTESAAKRGPWDL